MFLEANRTQMYKAEYLNQAIALMQTQALVSGINATHLPDAPHDV